MPALTVYLDECVNHDVIEYLHRRGFGVRTAQAEGMAAAKDDDQLRYASANGWLLLSVNERDFYSWHVTFQRNQWSHSGIITIPQTAVILRLFVRCAMMLDWISTEFPDPQNTLFRWTDLQQHLNSGYFLDGYTNEEIALALGRTS